MAVTLSQSEINDLAEVLGIGAVRENVEEGSFSADDGRAILTARGHTIEQITGVIPDDEGYGFIPDVVGSIGTATQVISSSVTTPILDYAQLIADINGFVTDAVRDSIGSINAEAERTAVEALTDALSEIRRLNEIIDNQAKQYQDLIEKAIQVTRDEMLRAEQSSERSILDSVLGAFDTQARALADSDTAIKDVVLDAASKTRGVVEEVEENVRGVATAIRESLPEVAETVMSGVESVTSGFPDLIGGVVNGLLEGFGLDKVTSFFQIIGNAMDFIEKERGTLGDITIQEGSWDVPRSNEDINNIWTAVMPIIGQFVQIDHPAEFERMRLDSWAWTRPTPLDQGSTLEFIRRFPNRRPEVNENLERAGLDNLKINQLMSIIHNPLTLYENMQLWLRGELTDDEYLTNLRALALSDEDIELTKKLAYPIPPIGDLIRFVVRDVYDEQVVEEGRLKEGFNTFPVETARKIGLADEWSEKYWMAHWMLPSLGQGFEMLHRLPDWDDKLEALFKAADLAPGYWDDMKAISYRPLTRVDTRRMNLFLPDFGPEQVKDSYLQLGYNEENAQRMTDFTVAYNQRSRESAPDRDLTKSDIIGMYNDGVFTSRTEALNYLMAIGYDETESEYLLEREDLQKDNKERKDAIDDVIAMAVAGAYSPEAALDELGHHDLSQAEEREARIKLTRAKNVRTKTPSKSDLDKWYEMDIIKDWEYEAELAILGYPEKYIALYLEEMAVEGDEEILSKEVSEAGKREPRRVTKGQLDSLYLGQIILEDEYISGLRTLGYRDTDIANFVIEVNLKLDEQLQEEQDRIARGEEAPRRERLPSRVILGKMYLKGLIDINAYKDGLTKLGFNQDNIDLLVSLITEKAADAAE